jgi:hypothetical protein
MITKPLSIEKLGPKERQLLLRALEFDLENLICVSCEDITTYDVCAIMPPVLNPSLKADILCGSILCMATWMEAWNHE